MGRRSVLVSNVLDVKVVTVAGNVCGSEKRRGVVSCKDQSGVHHVGSGLTSAYTEETIEEKVGPDSESSGDRCSVRDIDTTSQFRGGLACRPRRWLTNRRQEDTKEKDQKGPSVMSLGRRIELGRQPVVVRHGVGGDTQVRGSVWRGGRVVGELGV
jgi:hypothetical protein